MINSVPSSTLESFKVEARQLLTEAIANNQQQQTSGGNVVDVLTLGNQPVDAGTYTAAAAGADSAGDILTNAYKQLREMFANTLHEQGIATKVATGNGEIDLETLTPEDAQALIADDGYFGVDNTAKRIFDFATGLAGDDPSRVSAIIDGIKDGFADAEQAWGGALPDISYATRDSLQEMLKEWSGQDIDLAG